MTAPALASVDPRSLSAPQRRVLFLLNDGAALWRKPNGYGRPGDLLRLDVVNSLRGLGLVSTPPGKPLALTYGGKIVAALVAEGRRP